MAVGGFGGLPGALGGRGRAKAGRFVALTGLNRIVGTVNQSGKLVDLLEKRGPFGIKDVIEVSLDGLLTRESTSIRTIEPRDIFIVMSAPDGEPVYSQAQRDALGLWRLPFEVSIEAGPFRVIGQVYLRGLEDIPALSDPGGDAFLPVFDPVVQVSGVTLRDAPRDSVMVNRSHIQRATTTVRR